MSNSYYNHTTYPAPNSPGSSANLRAELELIAAGFDKLPTLSGNGNKLVVVNSAGTALTVATAFGSVAITGSTIDSTPIGATTPSTGAFTTLTANSSVNLGSAVTIAGGTINNTPIGGTTPNSGAFTTLSASSGLTGNVTGNLTGNVTGNVTGNLTGNVTGNVTAGSGTSTFNNVTINGQLDMDAGSSATIINLSTPTNSGDAANKGYVDTQAALKLNLSGGTMSGAIAMGTNKITGLGTPTLSADATTKTYVDTADALKLNLSGGTMSGAIAMGTNRITGLGDPSSAQDAATKNYVDGVAQGLDTKPSVRCATTANITLSGTQTIDGVAVIANDRVLVKNQSTSADNGIYVVAAGSWSRATDMDAWTEFPGAFVFVEDGTTNDNTGWVCTVAPGGTLGSTSVTWEQFSGAGQITAGAGLTKTGNTLDVGTASTSRIVVNADNIDLATTGVSAGTYKSITVDAYGRATAGTNPTTLSGYGITDAYTTSQVDTALALKLNLSGGTLSGNLAMGTNRITGVGDPTNSQDAATKSYTDTALALKLNLSGGTMSGAIAMGSNKITGMADPASNQDAATKYYVDSILGSATSAAASASAAALSATAAGNSATAASTSAGNASTSASNAATSLYNFVAQYLGPLSSNPTVDGNGNAVTAGDLYFNTSANEMRVYSGSAWAAAYLPAAGYVAKSGDTMTGYLTLSGAPTSDLHASTKKYVDDSLSPYLTSATAASTYQTQAGMSSYLTTASAASTYQTQAGMSSYLTTSSAASTYLALAGGTLTGSVAFSGTSLRITGDFSNATIASRLILQSSTTNGNTGVTVIPNGTATTATWRAYNSSSPDNASVAIFGAFSAEVRLASELTGTGSYQPITIHTGGSERARFDTSGRFGIGQTPAASQGFLQVLGTGITGGAPASSGSTDANQIGFVGAGTVQTSFGAYANGDAWIQQRSSSNFATNYNLFLNPNGGVVGVGSNFLVGGSAQRGTTVGTNHVDIFNGTAPAGTLTNGISLYSSSGDFNFMDSGGNGFKVGYRNVPAVGTKTGSYTLAAADVGKYVQLGSGGSITVPASTFAEGDIVSLANNTTGNITITCSAVTTYIAGTDSVKTSLTLATRGIASVFFLSSSVCIVTGNVS